MRSSFFSALRNASLPGLYEGPARVCHQKPNYRLYHVTI